MSWSRADVEILLQEYQKHVNLYNVKSLQYKNRNLRKKSLDSITETLKTYKPAVTSQEIQSKFQALKQTAQKERTKIKNSLHSGSGSDSVYESSLWYLDMINFAFDMSEPRPSVDMLDDESQIDLPTENESDGHDNSQITLPEESVPHAITDGRCAPGKSGKKEERQIMSSVSRNLEMISKQLCAPPNPAAVAPIPAAEKRQVGVEDPFSLLVQTKMRKIENEQIKEETELDILKILQEALKRDRAQINE